MIRGWGHLRAGIVMIFIVAILSFSGRFESLNNAFTDLRFSLLEKAPSGDAVIIAIDSKSLRQMPDWPWPRSYHGELVRQLDALGAESIAFDVDFSAPAIEADNDVFAAAMAEAEADTYLASFRQSLSQEMPDVIAEILPVPALQASAQLASVNYQPEPNGLVRMGNRGQPFSFGTVPSFATALTGEEAGPGSFMINFAISPDRIRQVSYGDVLNGTADPELIRGKRVFVGATAVELGDEYVMPVYGVRSGVALNVLSFETLHQEATLTRMPAWLALGVAVLLMSGLLMLYRCKSLVHTIAGILSAGLAVFVSSLVLQGMFGLVPVTAEIFCSLVLLTIFICYQELQKRNYNLFRAQMEIRQNHALLEAMVVENHEGMLTINHDDEIQICNERAINLLGFSTRNILGKKLADIHPELLRLVDKTVEGDGVVGQFDLAVPLPDGDTRYIDVTVSRVRMDPQESRYERRTETRRIMLFVLHDMTAQKEAELKERTAKETLELTLEAKSQLISTMSHELRTPLNAIIGFSKIYEDQLFGPLGADEYGEYAGLIHSSGRQLLSVINDILLAGKIQSRELSLSPDRADPHDIFDAAETRARSKPSWKAQKVSHDFDRSVMTVNVDHDALQTALSHLIDNAAKFSGEAGDISLKTMRRGRGFVFEVSDNGPGAEVQDLRSLTEMLRQGNSAHNRQYEGCGLGLYLVEQIAALHGGRLELASSESGFTARMILPDVVGQMRREQAA